MTIKSLDDHTIAKFDLDQPLLYDDQPDLVKATMRRSNGPAINLGALNGKISDAGGCGYMFLYCPFETQAILTEWLEILGAMGVDFSFEQRGLQSWETVLSHPYTIPNFPG